VFSSHVHRVIRFMVFVCTDIVVLSRYSVYRLVLTGSPYAQVVHMSTPSTLLILRSVPFVT